MKVPVSDAAKPIGLITRAYLSICIIIILIVRKIFNLLFGPHAILFFVTIPIILLGLFFALGEFNHAVTAYKKKAAYDKYSFFNKAIPNDFFTQAKLSCPPSKQKIHLNLPNQVHKINLLIENHSDHLVFMGARAVKHPLNIRPRLWDASMNEIIKDGIPIPFNPMDIVAIPTKGKLRGEIEFHSSVLKNAPRNAKFLAFNFVQEGVKWAPSSITECVFEVQHG